MEKKVTVKDIASRMGVSLSTVNKALTGKPGVSEERRAEVISVAKEMGYVVNHVAQSLSRKPIHIGVVIPSGWQQYFASVAYGMQMQFEKLAQSNVHGKFVHVDSTEQIQEAFERFYQEKADSIIYCPSLYALSEDFKAYVAAQNTPVFIVGNDYKELSSVCTVSVNSELSGSMAADYFKVLLGEQDQVAVFIGSQGMYDHVVKANAFQKRAREGGLNPVGIYENFDDSEMVGACIAQMYAEYPQVKGIYVATAMTKPIVDYFRLSGDGNHPYIIATDLYDGIQKDMADGYVHGTIFQNQVLMGRLAVKMSYRYLVGISSYNATANEFSERINVTPHLFLPANVEEFTLDDGNDYTLE